MVRYRDLLTVRVWAPLSFVFVLTVLLVIDHHASLVGLLAGFREAFQPIIALSVSLVIFPFITVPAVESIVSRAKKLNLYVNPSLVKDYVDACFTVFIMALSEIVLLIVYSFTHKTLIAYTALATLTTMILVLFTLMAALWQVTALFYKIIE